MTNTQLEYDALLARVRQLEGKNALLEAQLQSSETDSLTKKLDACTQTHLQGGQILYDCTGGTTKQASVQLDKNSWWQNYCDMTGDYYPGQGETTNHISNIKQAKSDKPAWAENYLDLMESQV